jgi:NAD(P)-dependent dehydrogenase (short-subunit alcohol dehydrogenase family)
MRPSGMTAYASLCGWTLARAHARSGDRIAIAAYLGSRDRFEEAVADFAETYADLNEKDYDRLQHAARDGIMPVQTGV